MGNSWLFIDSLERRQLLAAVAGVPILAQVTGKTPTFVLPNQSISMSLSITNSGGDLSRTSVPVGIYVSDDPTMDSDANFLAVQDVKLSIKHGKTQKVSLKKFPLPAADLSTGGNYVLLQVDDNTSNTAIPQGDTTNTVAASPEVYDPVGEYASTVTGDANDDISLQLYNYSGSVLQTNGSVDTDANIGSVEIDNMKTTISSTGKFSAKGSYHYSPYSYSYNGGGKSKVKQLGVKGAYSYGYSSGGGSTTDTLTVTGGLKVVDGTIELVGSFTASVKIQGDRADSGTAKSTFTATLD